MHHVVPHSMLVTTGAASSSAAELLLWLVPIAASILVLAFIDHAVAALRAALQRRRAARERPGSNPLRPLPVGSFEEIAGRPTPCRCGATQHKVFEGPAPAKLLRLWLVIEACPTCGERQRTYFDVTRARGNAPRVGAPPLTPVPR